MEFLDTTTKAFRAIPNIGVTPDIRPEEAKHIKYLNIGFALMVIINLAYFLQNLVTEEAPLIIPLGQFSGAVLCLLVFVLNRLGHFTAARVYGFLLFYANGLLLFTLSGKEIVDHYMIFISIGYAFFVFPKKEKGLLGFIIVLGVICYLTILFLYEYVVPVSPADPNFAVKANRVLLHIVFLVFIVLMISGRYFTEQMENSLMQEREKLTEMSALLKKMFGRYLSTEVMNSLIQNPSALELGGEKRSVTIMMSDLRGFTALSERLAPEHVVKMLNTYFEVMVEVILKYHGTINEIIGDALLIVFGAPQEMPDRARQAIACAIEMQNVMADVNARNRAEGLPDLEMGIGLNETEVIVGNIGSSRRSKYAVVGSGVNMTSRIESYTVGGQILISESVLKEAGEVLRIDNQRDVFPKGSETPLRIYEVGGIAGDFNLALMQKEPDLVSLARHIPIRCAAVEGKDVEMAWNKGMIGRLSKNSAEITLGAPVDTMTDLKMNLADVEEKLSSRDFYGKVIKLSREAEQPHLVHFTSVPPEVDSYFQAFRRHSIPAEGD
jgi:adenylate cyclase